MASSMTEGRVSAGATTSWRRTVTERPLAGALVAGFVATHVATVTGYWYHGLALTSGAGFPDLGWLAFNGLLLIPGESALAQFWAGTIYHLFTGLSFSLVYAFLLFPMFRGRNSVGGNILKALVFAMVLATISALWWVPQLFPDFNPGFFSWNLGWKTVFGIYLWHVIYGLNLGALYSPLAADAS